VTFADKLVFKARAKLDAPETPSFLNGLDGTAASSRLCIHNLSRCTDLMLHGGSERFLAEIGLEIRQY
jgi:hypothetical protein